MSKGFGPFGKIQEALKKAQQVRDGAQKLQAELEAMEVVGETADGLVKVTVSGNQEPRKVELTSEALTKSPEELQELVLEAMKTAYYSSSEIMRERMEALTGDISLPGLGLGG
ncbi:MAG: YbaB/EbfC family nucleoid-associated protein [Synechococcaceae cyanobacterium RM1_1_27]|nr:YbaB/EbfC family nucleoid-associated protein [Synechococcaceae cyanobacterium SM2_3_2]NJO85673.1 YbaB/EbfC family nucleoid-associated protein [Synechococcaceae cyanobacterium RM1_1_27]